MKPDIITNAKTTKEIYDFFIEAVPLLRNIRCNIANLSKKHLGTRDLEPLAQKSALALKECFLALEEIHYAIHPDGKLVD